MAEYRLEGESFLQALPLELADCKEFHGVVVYRFWGTRVQIDEATRILTEAYPHAAKDTLGDAKWLGKVQMSIGAESLWVDLYELIVMREARSDG